MGENYFGYRLLLLVFIVGSNAFFAAAEMALISVRQSRLRELADQGVTGAHAALTLLRHPERLLSTVQVGVTLAGLGAGWAGEDTVFRAIVSLVNPLVNPATAALIHGISFVFAFLFLTFVMVVFGEVVPKNLGIHNSERLALIAAPVILVLYRIAGPFVYVLERSSAAVSRLLGLRSGERGSTHSPEELKSIVSSIRANGRLSEFEEDLVHHGLDLREISVREIMVPRNDIVSVPVTASLEQVLDTFASQQHARLPVYDTRPEQIIGILHYKDFFPVLQRLGHTDRHSAWAPSFRLRALLRKHLVVPETKPLSQMIDEFRRNRAQMAMVVDEFGTIVGLVTLEDVLEQIFGEIEDEHDVGRVHPLAEAPVLELEGTVPIRDLESQYGIELPTNAGFETLAGFLLFRFNDIPKAGDTIEYDGRRFTILEMDRNRISRVRIEKILEPAPASNDHVNTD